MATLPIRRGPSELIGVAQQLVAPAHGEDDRPARRRGAQVLALFPGQVGGAQLLVAVLTAADVVQVGAVGV
jgi:hypothetical protein